MLYRHLTSLVLLLELFVIGLAVSVLCVTANATVKDGEQLRDFTEIKLEDYGFKPVEPRKDADTGFNVGGKNATDVLTRLTQINGKSIADLEKAMRPGVDSTAGFLGNQEKLLDVLAADNKYVVDEMGLTHQELARHLHAFAAVWEWQFKNNQLEAEFLYHGQKFKIKVVSSRGFQDSPFGDGTKSGSNATIHDLTNGKKLEYALLVPYMIERYGFYEGTGTSYRVDPRKVVEVLGFIKKNSQRSVAADPPATFTGEKTAWHGFDRYDFLMDEATFALKPIKAAPDEKNGVGGQVPGQLRCVVVVPREAAPGLPWSWRGYYFDHEPQAEIELLKRGFHIGFILSDAGKHWDAWYTFLTEQHGFSKKPSFVGMSRGGRNAFTWSTANPDKVSCIYVDNPAISRESLMKLGDMAQNDVPLLHVCGSLDPILGNHTLAIESIYQQLGGRISVMIKEGAGHHPHSLRDPTPIADFIVHSLHAPSGDSPAFAGKKFTRTSFYGVENSYREFPKEGTYITCRGPWFSESYDRYEFRLDGIKGAVTVIAPQTAAPGMPWVFRADFVTRDAVVDLALLGKGFHIVVGPVPTDVDGPVLQQWNAVYEYLIGHGFSRKPVMEGAGGAAGEAYAWAIANPDKVSCIYAENPLLRSNLSKVQPLDNLAPLAKVGVQILHVCGSLDPWFKSQTGVAQMRYRELGGQITIIEKAGEGHYPLAPKDRQPVVDFIVKSVAAGNLP